MLDDVVKIHVKRCGLTQMSMEEIIEHLEKVVPHYEELERR